MSFQRFFCLGDASIVTQAFSPAPRRQRWISANTILAYKVSSKPAKVTKWDPASNNENNAKQRPYMLQTITYVFTQVLELSASERQGRWLILMACCVVPSQ